MSLDSFAAGGDRNHPEFHSSRSTAPSAPEELAALAGVGQEFASSTTLADGFQRAMRRLDQRLGVRRAILFVGDGTQRTITVEAVYGILPEDVRIRHGFGVTGRVAESGRPIVVPAVRREPMALSELANPAAWYGEHLSLVSVPVSKGGRCAGALSVYFAAEPRANFAARLCVLEIVASVIAQALDTARFVAGEDPSPEPQERVVFEYANMIGTSPAMRQIYEEVGQVARTTATALILGESGTGKELVAQAIHANSDRARQPFIKINGAAFPEGLFESELFGHERGAFTGAHQRKKGRLDLAEGGTLFLDEICELPLSTQVKLLRVLQFREYERLGGTETLKANVRLIAATNKNVAAAVASGTFREDLYYRLDVFSITLPPLRDRRSDIPALAEYFLEKFAVEHRRRIRRIASGALSQLVEYAWPGNVRELENAIERAVVVCDGSVIEERHLPEAIRAASRPAPAPARSLSRAVEQLERQMIEDALRESQGNMARAARALGTTERVLRYKIDKYAIETVRWRTR